MTPCTVRGEAYSPPTMSSVYRVPCNQTGSCWSKRQCSDFRQLIRPLSSLSSMLTAARETLETLRTQALLPDNSAGIEPILQKSGPHLCFLKFNGNNFFKFYVSMMLWFSWGWSLSVCALWHAQSEGNWNLQKQKEWIFLDINCIEQEKEIKPELDLTISFQMLWHVWPHAVLILWP